MNLQKRKEKYIYQFVFGVLFLFLLFLIIYKNNPSSQLIINFGIGMIVSFSISLLSLRLHLLTFSGFITAAVLATLIFGLGGLKWGIPLFSFFLFSSILSSSRKSQDPIVDEHFEKSSTRDHWQVIANGGLGGILILLFVISPKEIFYILYVSTLAAVCADTWATEIGTFVKAKTYNIINWMPVEQGISGGISLIGTLGAFAGSIFLTLSALPWLYNYPVSLILWIIFAGIIGSLVDSLLGATIQIQYRCGICNIQTEKKTHCNNKTLKLKGSRFVNNDAVNFIGGLSGALTTLIFITTFYSGK